MTPSFEQAYQELLSLSNLVVKPFSDSLAELKRSRRRTEAFLKILGNPHKKMKFVHVTGTSGKGTVTMSLHQILRASGETVGSYVSPHPTSYSERFLWNDGLLPENLLTSAINDVLEAYKLHLKTSLPLTFFELTTCLALHAFYKEGATWAVMEVGMGGRWDSTNIIPTPEVAVITNIDRDHTQILGNSLKEIAYAKAGIIKKDGVVIVGESRPSLKSVFTKEAIEHNAALFFVPPQGGGFKEHNRLLIERAAKEIGIDEQTVHETLNKQLPLPCRFETVSEHPHIILDGAHSETKMKTTANQTAALGTPVHVLFGCAADKDVDAILKQLIPIATTITTTRFTGDFRKAANPAGLERKLPKRLRNGFFLDPVEAFEHVQKTTKGTILITGSFFLAGELRNLWYPEAAIRKQATSFPTKR